MRYFVILLILIGFSGIVYATHDPNQPIPHSIVLPSDMKDSTFDEFMKWCKPYYKERCTDMYEKNKTSKLSIPLKLNNLASKLWYDHDYIIDGTILNIRGYDQPERVYDIKINSFFKPAEGTDSKVITVYGSPNFYNSKGDRGIFFIKKDDARWVFGEYGAKATPECPPELMYHLPLEPQVYTRVPASGIDFDYAFDCYPHYYKRHLPQYMKAHGATEFPSPLSQQIDRVSPDEVVCNEGLELIMKNNGLAVCVKSETKQKLIERDWAKTNSIQIRNPVSIPVPPDPMHITINGSTTPFVIPIKAGETKSIDILLEPKIPIVYSVVNVESYFGSAGECKDIDIDSYCPGRGIDIVLSDTSITSQKEITLTINVSDNVTNGTYAYKITTDTIVESPDDKLRTVGNSLRFDLNVK